MRIKLKTKDSGLGNYVDIHDCPIARALNRKGYSSVSVGNKTWVGKLWGLFSVSGIICDSTAIIAQEWTYNKQLKNLTIKL